VPDPTPPAWRTIGQLADLVGGWCWVEGRLFELTGAWAGDPGAGAEPGTDPGADPEIDVFFAAASRAHAGVAAQWRDRLPVRAGVEVDGLIVPPSGPEAASLSLLEAAQGPLARLAGLVLVVLPHLVRTYGLHLAAANPASEAPVMAVLGPARRNGSAEVRRGRFLLQRVGGADGLTPEAAELVRNLEQVGP
jgi:hypothetical protein